MLHQLGEFAKRLVAERVRSTYLDELSAAVSASGDGPNFFDLRIIRTSSGSVVGTLVVAVQVGGCASGQRVFNGGAPLLFIIFRATAAFATEVLV